MIIVLDPDFGGYARGTWPASAARGPWTTEENLGTWSVDEGAWSVDEFSGELAKQLTKYNIKVVEKTSAHDLVAKIDLGIWGNRHVIAVVLDRNGEEALAGRVGVPDLSWTTLDAAAEPVAQIIARKAWGIPEPPPADD